MLYIKIRNENVCSHVKPSRTIVWHLGQPNPFQDTTDDMNNISEISADGDELKYIADMFVNIPMARNKRSVRWFSCHAKFIAVNL